MKQKDEADIVPCFYCGLPANSVDHFIPQVVAERMGWLEGQKLIPACRECNSMLGARVYRTLGLRREAAKLSIWKKYGRYASLPKWTEEEIAELGHNLQSKIQANQKLRMLTWERLRWHGAFHATPNSPSNDLGNDTVQPIADNEDISKELLSKQQKHYSSTEQRKFIPELGTCPFCAKEFVRHQPTQKYCSSYCGGRFRVHTKLPREQQKTFSELRMGTCTGCAKQYRRRTHCQKFCCQPCRYQHQKNSKKGND